MSPKKKNKKKFLSAWIAVGIFIVLVGISVYLDRGDAIDRNKIKIFEVVKDDLISFELTNNTSKETVLCVKDGNDWAMVKPKPYELEKTEVDVVASNIASLTIDRKIEKPESPASYGLEKPSNTVSFTLKSGKKSTLLIGDKNPTGTFYYVKDKNKAEIYVAYGFSIETLIKTADSLRKKSIFEMDTAKISRVDIKSEAKEFSLVKDGDKKWLINPYGFKANNEEVEKYIAKMKELKAIGIVDDNGWDLNKYGIQAPRLTLAVTLSDNRKINVLIGKKHLTKDADYAKIENSPVIYAIDSEFLKGADKAYNSFRDKLVIDLAAKDINEVEIVKGKKRITAKKGTDGKYSITEPVLPPSKKGAEVLFPELVRSMVSFSVKSFVDDSGRKFENYGLKNPAFVVSIYGTENNERKLKAKVSFGDAVKTDYYAKIDSSESVFSVSGDAMGKVKEIESAVEKK